MKNKSMFIVNLLIIILLITPSSNLIAKEITDQVYQTQIIIETNKIDSDEINESLDYSLNLPLVLSNTIILDTVLTESTNVLPDETTQYLSSISDDGSVYTLS